MTRPRSQLVSLEATPYYHCISRCVRRAFLCGKDRFSGKSFDHRKPWLVARMALLTNIFAIDIAAYAVMSNHYHLVLQVDAARVDSWSDDEVIARWFRLYKGPLLIHRLQAGESLSTPELVKAGEFISHFRRQLCNISRFMACLNEYIARRANLEDGCTGRFWEGRFKSQALLDEAALLSCMVYVDLNPIRAGIATDLPDSDFTSVQQRIRALGRQKGRKPLKKVWRRNPALLPFSETQREDATAPALPYTLKDYLEVSDWTGRVVRSDKKGHIKSQRPRLLAVLGLSDAQWQLLALEVQKQSILMLDGLGVIAAREKKASKAA